MQHIGTTTRPRLILAAALTALLAVGGLVPWRVVAQSGASASTCPIATQREEAWKAEEQTCFASESAKADAQFAEILKQASPAQLDKVQPEVSSMTAEVTKYQRLLQTTEEHRTDYLAAHPNRLSDAQTADITKLLDLNIKRNDINAGVAWRNVIRGKLLADLSSARDLPSRKGFQRQVSTIDRQRLAAEREVRALEPLIAQQKVKVALIPEDQRELMAMLRHYDVGISCGITATLAQKQVRIAMLRELLARAGRPPARRHPSQGTTIKASSAPPVAKTASFNALAIGGPPPLRLAQSGASLSTPSGVTENEEALHGKVAAEFAARDARLEAQLAATLKALSPEQRKKAEAHIAFLSADDAKTKQHIQMLEQHRADYLAAHPNRLSDAQVALVQKFNWDKLDPYRINEGIRWEQSIRRKLQAHIDSSNDARSRQGWQRQIAAIERRRQAAQRQIRELMPAIAREEAEVAAIPEDQKARVTKLRSYDSEISAYRNIALVDKQIRIEMLRQKIAGEPHGGRQNRGAEIGTSLPQLGQAGMDETQPSHTTGQSVLATNRQSAAPDTALFPLLFQIPAPPTKTNLSVNWWVADLARRLSDLHQGTPLKLVLQRIAILGGKEDGGLQTIPATRYYFSPGVIVEIPAKDGVITGPLRVHPGGFDYD